MDETSRGHAERQSSPPRAAAARCRGEYLEMRRAFQPRQHKLIFVAESPPVSGRYFYDPTGPTTEHLFAAIMKQLRITPRTKEEGLVRLQSAGWVLVDATYTPVNDLTNKDRNAIVLADYDFLLRDLRGASGLPLAPVVLLKANVCRLLEARLLSDGFNVLNKGRVVPFPSHGQQRQTFEQLGAILAEANVLEERGT